MVLQQIEERKDHQDAPCLPINFLKQHHSNLQSLSITFNAIGYESSFSILNQMVDLQNAKADATSRYLQCNWQAPLGICS
jgi:hypothetical protein